MYQVNIPFIYVELKRRNSKTMSKVISIGSGVAVFLYFLLGFLDILLLLMILIKFIFQNI